MVWIWIADLVRALCYGRIQWILSAMEKRFDDVDALKRQMAQDCLRKRAIV